MLIYGYWYTKISRSTEVPSPSKFRTKNITLLLTICLATSTGQQETGADVSHRFIAANYLRLNMVYTAHQAAWGIRLHYYYIFTLADIHTTCLARHSNPDPSSECLAEQPHRLVGIMLLIFKATCIWRRLKPLDAVPTSSTTAYGGIHSLADDPALQKAPIISKCTPRPYVLLRVVNRVRPSRVSC